MEHLGQKLILNVQVQKLVERSICYKRLLVNYAKSKLDFMDPCMHYGY